MVINRNGHLNFRSTEWRLRNDIKWIFLALNLPSGTGNEDPESTSMIYGSEDYYGRWLVGCPAPVTAEGATIWSVSL